MNPMIPFLTGWLTSAVDKHAKECMKVLHIHIEAPNAFVVEFASGLKLRVSVEEIKP